jgi:hypothetical protein
MSTFTKFSGEEALVYNHELSEQAGKDLWNTIPGFRYYLGKENSNEYVDVETGFVTDGATIPRILWWLLPPIGEYSQCTTLHDKLCTTYYYIRFVDGVEVKVALTRKQIDEILKESMDVKKVTWWKKKAIMAGVNLHRILRNPTAPKPVYELA